MYVKIIKHYIVPVYTYNELVSFVLVMPFTYMYIYKVACRPTIRF